MGSARRDVAERALGRCVSVRFMSVLVHYFVLFLRLFWFLLSTRKLPVKVCLKYYVQSLFNETNVADNW